MGQNSRSWLWPWFMGALAVLWLLVRPWITAPPDQKSTLGEADLSQAEAGAIPLPDPGPVLELVDQLNHPTQLPSDSQALITPGSNDRRPDREDTEDEWLSLPRSRALLEQLVGDLGTGATDRSRLMFRNVYLNPHDRKIPRSMRAELETVIGALAPSLAHCYQAWINVYAQDMERAIATGQAAVEPAPTTTVIARPDGGSKKMVTLNGGANSGKWDMFSLRDGVLYRANRKDSPMGRSALEVQRFTELHLSLSIIKWFERTGCLDRNEARSLEERAVRSSER